MATNWPHDPVHSADYDRLVFWVVASALAISAQSDQHSSKIYEANAALRLVAESNEAFVMQALAGRCTSVQDLLEVVTAMEAAEPAVKRFMKIRVLLQWFVESLAPITRVRDGFEGEGGVAYYLTRTSPMLPSDLDPSIDGETELQSTYLYFTPSEDPINPDHTPHRIYGDIPADGHRATWRLQGHQAQRRTSYLTNGFKRRQAIPTQAGSFTEHEVRLVMAGHESFAAGTAGKDWRMHAVIVASLMASRTPRELQSMPHGRDPRERRSVRQWLETSGGVVRFCYEPEVTDFAFGPVDRQLLGERPAPLKIAFPNSVSAALLRLWQERGRGAIRSAEINDAFARLLSNASRPQTFVRMAAVVRDRIIRSGQDHAIAAMVGGYSPQTVPALYYLTADATRIEKCYREIVDALPGGPFEWPASEPGQVGSQLNVDASRIGAFCAAAAEELEEMRELLLRSAGPEDIVRFHNRFIVLVAINLMLATGHRPVRSPFELISDLDLDTGMLFVSDKEQRIRNQGRYIPIPAIAVDQVRALLRHLVLLPQRFGIRPPSFWPIAAACVWARSRSYASATSRIHPKAGFSCSRTALARTNRKPLADRCRWVPCLTRRSSA